MTPRTKEPSVKRDSSISKPEPWKPAGIMPWSSKIKNPGLLSNQEAAKAHPLNRSVGVEKSKQYQHRWEDTYHNQVKGSPIAAPYATETRPGSSNFGGAIPRMYTYGGLGWESGEFSYPNLIPEEEPSNFARQDFVSLANRLRPENFSIRNADEGSAYAYAQGNPAFAGSMHIQPDGSTDRNTAAHELEHTMQYRHPMRYVLGPLSNPILGERTKFDDTSIAEIPAVIAGTAAEARELMKNPEISEVRKQQYQNKVWQIPNSENEGYSHKGLTAKTMANLASRHMWGEDPHTGERVAPPRSVTDLLSTPEGRNYLALLNRKYPETEIQKQVRARQDHEASQRRQWLLEHAYQFRQAGMVDWAERAEQDAKSLLRKEGSHTGGLSKLAPALVSTQNNPSTMKTAPYEPADFTKEADLSELLGGL